MANNIIKGLGYHHVSLKAADYEKTVKFYTEGFGMTLYREWEEPGKTIAMLDIGDGNILEICSDGTSDESTNARYAHFALKVDDVEEAYAVALKAGAETKMVPTIVPLKSRPVEMTLHCAFVYGPSGEEIELFKIVK